MRIITTRVMERVYLVMILLLSWTVGQPYSVSTIVSIILSH